MLIVLSFDLGHYDRNFGQREDSIRYNFKN